MGIARCEQEGFEADDLLEVFPVLVKKKGYGGATGD